MVLSSAKDIQVTRDISILDKADAYHPPLNLFLPLTLQSHVRKNLINPDSTQSKLCYARANFGGIYEAVRSHKWTELCTLSDPDEVAE